MCKYTSMLVCTYMQVCKYASMLLYASMHICKYACMQECQYASMQYGDAALCPQLRHFSFILQVQRKFARRPVEVITYCCIVTYACIMQFNTSSHACTMVIYLVQNCGNDTLQDSEFISVPYFWKNAEDLRSKILYQFSNLWMDF